MSDIVANVGQLDKSDLITCSESCSERLEQVVESRGSSSVASVTLRAPPPRPRNIVRKAVDCMEDVKRSEPYTNSALHKVLNAVIGIG